MNIKLQIPWSKPKFSELASLTVRPEFVHLLKSFLSNSYQLIHKNCKYGNHWISLLTVEI